jgi:hypothetical protein
VLARVGELEASLVEQKGKLADLDMTSKAEVAAALAATQKIQKQFEEKVASWF